MNLKNTKTLELNYAAEASATRKFASVGNRFAAMIYDYIFLMLSSFFLIVVIGLPLAFFVGIEKILLYAEFMQLPVIFFYCLWFECHPQQSTFGKRKMDVFVEDVNGHRLSFSRSLARNIFKYSIAIIAVGLFLVYPDIPDWVKGVLIILFYLSWAVAIFHPRKQALHDILAGTYVCVGRKEPEREVAASGTDN